MAQSWIGTTLKRWLSSRSTATAEIIHRRGPWKTREAVELATLEWVAWFNRHRLLQPIGYIAPAEAEANYWRQQAQVSVTTKPVEPAALQEGEP